MRGRHAWVLLISIVFGAIWLALVLFIYLSPSTFFFSFLLLIPWSCACVYLVWALFTPIFLSIHAGDRRRLWKPIAVSWGCIGLSIVIPFLSERFDLSFHVNKARYLEVLALADAEQLEYTGINTPESNYRLPSQYAYLSFDGGIKATGKTIMFHSNCDPLTRDFCTGVGYRPSSQAQSFPLPNCPPSTRWRPVFGESDWYVCK